uniref:Uncharacterized protein n=1 Tax=Panagrolaimus superbus TaxID=310955 RepID=A0A914YCF4_9BILA
MSKAKVMVEEGEEIIISCPSSASSQIYSNLLIRKKDHYQVIRSQTDSDLSLSQEWKKKLLKNSNPKKVILMRLSPMDSAHFLLKCSHLFENALVIREESHFTSIHNVIVEKVMHVLGDKITPYDVTIQCLSKIAVLMDEVLLINVEYIKALPVEESVIIDVDPGKVVTVVGSSQSPKNFPIVFQKNSIKLSTFKTKKAKVTLKIDINSFHDLKVEPIDEDIADEKLSKMEQFSDAKFRLVFDKQNFGIFAVKDAKEQTQIHASDGMFRKNFQFYIAFTDKKPVIGKPAEEIYVQQPKLVVFGMQIYV